MKRFLPGVVGLVTLSFPITGTACEPVFPIVQLLSASSAAGPALITRSLFWLLMAIAIKCVAFICFEKRLSWSHAAAFMLIANFVSTIPGVLLAASAAQPFIGLILVFPMAYGLGAVIQQRTRRLPPFPWQSRVSGNAVAIAFVLFYVISMVLYGYTQVMLDKHEHASYWVLKLLFVTLVACTGIVISAVLEEGVIASLLAKRAGNASFYTSVIRANYVTLGMILLAAAITIIPQRLRSPGLLAAWFERICASIGLS